MEKKHILQAIQICRAGQMPFNNGESIYCFLFDNTWFPLRATVSYASQIAGENLEYTKNDAMVKIHDMFEYVKIRQINVQNNILSNINTEEKLLEISVLSSLINTLAI